MGRNCYSFRLYELLLATPNVCPRLVLLLLLVSAVLTVPRVHSSPASAALNSITAADDQLTAHQLDQLYRQQELTRLKQRILEGLGLTKIPDVSKMNVSREEYERMYRVYLRSVEEQRRREQEEADRIPQQSRSPSSASANPLERAAPPQSFYSFLHAPSSAPNEVRRETERRREARDTAWLYFPMDITERDVDVSSASLRLLLLWPGSSHHRPLSSRHTLTLRVYQLLRPDEDAGGSSSTTTGSRTNEPERLLIDQKELRSDAAGTRWAELDVRRAVEAWLRDPSSNLGLELQCRGCAAAGATLDTEEQPPTSSMGPVLNVLTSTRSGDVLSRGRRSIDFQAPMLRRTNCSSTGERCCRHSMKVVFKELEDFDFILQPTDYDAGYCKGRCPPRYNPASHHALLQSLVWKRDRSLAPRPCCAPSKLKSLQMLVLDADDPTKLRVVSWTEMEVEECACT